MVFLTFIFLYKIFMSSYQNHNYVDAFLNCWIENSNNYCRRDKKNTFNNEIVVFEGNKLTWYELTPNVLSCFYNVFNGPICDETHWKYFCDCIDNVSMNTGNYDDTYNAIRIGRITKIDNIY